MESPFPWIQSLTAENVPAYFPYLNVDGGQGQSVLFFPKEDQVSFLFRVVTYGAFLMVDVGYGHGIA